MARCPKCGHESDLDTYICDNCAYQLKVEKIEKIPFMKRPQDKWYKPDRRIVRFAKTIYRPHYAFRDINKKKDKFGGRFTRLITALFLGLWGVAINMKVNADFDILHRVIQGGVVFFIFFIFGLVYWRIVFLLYNFLYSLAANFSVRLDGILALRYNVKLKKKRASSIFTGFARAKQETTSEIAITTNEAAKPLTKISQTGKGKLMDYAYTPFAIASIISFLVLLIGLPTIEVNPSGQNVATLTLAMAELWDAPFVWSFLDVLQILAIFWSAVLMALAFREIGNCSTTRLLIGNLVVAFIISYTTVFLRPTLGWNFNFIEWISTLFG